METPLLKAQIEISSFGLFQKPSVEFAASFARQFGLGPDRLENLKGALHGTLEIIAEANRERVFGAPPILEVWESEGKIFCQVQNRGVPVFSKDSSARSRFLDISKRVDRITIDNKGREGQIILLEFSLGEDNARTAKLEGSESINREYSKDAPYEINFLQPHEAHKLSELFYYVYGYNYINELVYFPEKIAAMISDGRLVSTVARYPDGRIGGHVGLVRCNYSPPVYEACLGVVDPRLKSQGVFSQVFKVTMDKVQATPMQYCFFDYVTNHDYSQKLVSKYGTSDLAIFVGCQTKTLQARLEKIGLGKDPKDMDRYSILFSLFPQVGRPFGKEIALPSNIGEIFGFLIEPLNLSWSPTPRFSQLPAHGSYKSELQPAQLSVVFDFGEPGLDATEKLLGEWAELLRAGYQYAGINVPLDGPGRGQLYDMLAGHGFFAGGFLPFQNSNRLAFRFQSIAPTKVAFDQIKVFSPNAKKLLELVKQDYERNSVL